MIKFFASSDTGSKTGEEWSTTSAVKTDNGSGGKYCTFSLKLIYR
jgi:hypothetical protein